MSGRGFIHFQRPGRTALGGNAMGAAIGLKRGTLVDRHQRHPVSGVTAGGQAVVSVAHARVRPESCKRDSGNGVVCRGS